MTCPTPFEALARWWLDDLPEAEAAALEEHLFACDRCAAASERLGALVSGLREWIPPVISHAFRDRLASEGRRIRVTPVEAAVEAHARFGPDVDMLVHVLRGDLSRAESVDLEIERSEVGFHVVFERVPFDRSSGEVLIACQRHFRNMVPGDPTFKVFALEHGERRLVGTYLVVHEWA